MPLTTERATSLAASSYTCLVEQSALNTLSATNIKQGKLEKKQILILVMYSEIKTNKNPLPNAMHDWSPIRPPAFPQRNRRGPLSTASIDDQKYNTS